jgi:hypothetical protein
MVTTVAGFLLAIILALACIPVAEVIGGAFIVTLAAYLVVRKL